MFLFERVNGYWRRRRRRRRSRRSLCAFSLGENAWGPQDNDVGPVEPDLDVWSHPIKNSACSVAADIFGPITY